MGQGWRRKSPRGGGRGGVPEQQEEAVLGVSAASWQYVVKHESSAPLGYPTLAKLLGAQLG